MFRLPNSNETDFGRAGHEDAAGRCPFDEKIAAGKGDGCASSARACVRCCNERRARAASACHGCAASAFPDAGFKMRPVKHAAEGRVYGSREDGIGLRERAVRKELNVILMFTVRNKLLDVIFA